MRKSTFFNLRTLGFVILSSICLLNNSYSQNSKDKTDDKDVVIANAEVEDEAGIKLPDVNVKLEQKINGEYTKIAEGKTSKNGVISTSLDFNKDYVLVFKKEGFQRKKIWFDTKLKPPHEENYPFEYRLVLNKKLPDDINDLSADVLGQLLDKPVVKVYFNSEKREFDYDSLYFAQLKDELRKLRPETKKKLLSSLNSGNEDLFNQNLKDAKEELNAYDDRYAAAVRDGNKSFDAQDLLNARERFAEALGLKPNDPVSKKRLAEIDKLLDDRRKSTEVGLKYDDAVKRAEALLAQGKLTDSKKSFNEALSYKPNEKYPKEKIKEIDDRLYKELIAKADAAYKKNQLEDALNSYKQASDIKSNEQYPKDQIALINKLLRDKERDENYRTLIAKADKALANAKGEKPQKASSFLSAKTTYQEALTLKPTEKYPQERIAEINKALEGFEKDNEYQNMITEADKLFEKKDHVDARSTYLKALDLKPNEKYPKQRIAEIDAILKTLAETLAKGNQYADLIKKADKQFNKKDLVAARETYTAALKLMPNEKYPKEQIARIDELSKKHQEQNKIEDNYQSLLAKADRELDHMDFKNARNHYVQASDMRPNEEYPKDMIAAIDRVLRGEEKFTGLSDGTSPTTNTTQDPVASNDTQYKNAITKADQAFNQKKYSEAQGGYEEALSYKADEQYPKEMIERIKQLMNAIDEQTKDDKNSVLARETENSLNRSDLQKTRLALEELLHKLEKTKMNNLTTKYETKNPLTSLYDQVAEQHSADKNKLNSK